MPAKIDVDALKVFTKSRTNKTDYRQKINNSQSRLKIYRFYKGKVYIWLAHFWKILKPIYLKLLLTYYEFTHQQPQRRFTSFKKSIEWKKLFLFHIDQKIWLNSFVYLLIIIGRGICLLRIITHSS